MAQLLSQSLYQAALAQASQPLPAAESYLEPGMHGDTCFNEGFGEN